MHIMIHLSTKYLCLGILPGKKSGIDSDKKDIVIPDVKGMTRD